MNVVFGGAEEGMTDDVDHADPLVWILLRQRPDEIPRHLSHARRHQLRADAIFDVTLSHSIDTPTTCGENYALPFLNF